MTQTAPFQFPKPLHKPYRNLPVPFSKPLPCASFPFPRKPFSPRELPLRFHPLKDSSDGYLLEMLENPGGFGGNIGNLKEFDGPGMSNTRVLDGESSGRIIVPNPPWLEAVYLRGVSNLERKEVKVRFSDAKRENYNALMRRQVKEETEAWQRMLDEYKELVKEMCEKKLGPNLPYVKNLLLGWLEPFKEAIEKEQKRPKSRNKDAFSPNIDLLPADKMAVIVMYKMMTLLMMSDRCGSVNVASAAVEIGITVEHEVRMQSILKKANICQKNNASDAEDSQQKERDTLRKRVKGLITRNKLAQLQKLIRSEKPESWGRHTLAKLGCRLIHLLVEIAYVQTSVDQSIDSTPIIRPAFTHAIKVRKNSRRRMAPIRCGVIECDPLVLSGLESYAMHMIIPYPPMLVPPKKWKGYDKGGHLFLPSYIMRTHGSRKQRKLLKSTPESKMKKVYEALDTLGNTKWRVNQRILNVVETLWEKGGNVAGLVEREDVPIPEGPLSEDPLEIQQWKSSFRKARKTNSERHSLRCDTELKLSVARKLKDESCFYYPHNLDFRGRAYPMHPHLNHLGSDVCRGILEFAEGRPLGVSGLRWLKIQLANLHAGGVEKLSHEGRLAFVEDHMDDIFDSADNPINGKCWWLTAEDPFQCLAACINLSEALRSSSPTTTISHIPIHQDGSCNGLQHYAALGRNSPEAAAVNLVAREKPADVYSEIATRVEEMIRRDSNKDISTCSDAFLAKLLIDQVDRKLVKQTVMTSVYGVTFIGAREQIKRRLQEKGIIKDDELLFHASVYAAKVTLAALKELFGAARDIMAWLGKCAKVIASDGKSVQWTTPLGLPVVQPYFKREGFAVNTSLQSLSLQREGSSVEGRRQKTAFPPNFIHSLDGTHMMMTAVACRDAGLRFAGVHDSFWTHACDVDLMNRILREKFVELYSGPILENLLENFQKLHPDVEFPPLPNRGNFDLQEVLKSPYFFN